MLPAKIPGGVFGVLLIGAVHQLKENAYGAEISRLLVAHGRDAPTPRVYRYLSELEKLGLLESRINSEISMNARGKPPRVYSLTESSETVIDFFN